MSNFSSIPTITGSNSVNQSSEKELSQNCPYVDLENNNDTMIQDVVAGGSDKVGNINNESILISMWNGYIQKFKGVKGKSRPSRLVFNEIIYNTLLSFTGILIISVTDYFYLQRTFKTNQSNGSVVQMLTGAFGATAVLVFDLYQASPSQPRNVLLGHICSSFIGICVRKACGGTASTTVRTWIQAPIAMCASIFFMDLFECIHPPGGATAVIAVIGGKEIEDLGFGYILTCAGGAFISVALACIGNNLISTRQYPVYWW